MKRLLVISMLLSCDRTRSFSGTEGTFLVTVSGDHGSAEAPLDFVVDAVPYAVNIEAQGFAFDGPVLLDLLPSGRMQSAPVVAELTNGMAQDVEIGVELAIGEVHVVATDVGYAPVDALLAQCNNVDDKKDPIDDDGDGIANYPLDPGCFLADDDSEDNFGTGAAGASEPLWFANPTVENVQRSDSTSRSPLETFRVTIDRGLLVVTHKAIDGFYFTDVEGAKSAADLAWRSAFAFNFSTPELERGDCLSYVTGTVSEFFGFTELGFPDWEIDKSCEAKLPEPIALEPLQPDDSYAMEPYESGLARVQNATVARVATEFRVCDANSDGQIDYKIAAELECANDCGEDADCAVLEFVLSENQWTARLDGGTGAEIGVISHDADPTWDPLDHVGATIPEMTGVLRHLSFGEPAWILIPRDTKDFAPKP